jgi:hypothetical protein
LAIPDQLERLAALHAGGKLTSDEFERAKDETISQSVDVLQAAIGFVVAGFAAIISFIGLKGQELTTVIRNQEEWVALTGLFLFLAVAVAIVSIFSTQLFRDRQPRNVDELVVILILIGLGGLIFWLIPIAASTTDSQRRVAASIAGGATLLAVLLLIVAAVDNARKRRAERRQAQDTAPAQDQVTGTGTNGKERLRTRVKKSFKKNWWSFAAWLNHRGKPIQVFAFLIILSLSLVSLAVLMSLRLEARSQGAAGAQIRATITSPALVAGTTDSVVKVTIDVNASKLPQQDFVEITGYAFPREDSPTTVCRSMKTHDAREACGQDPCAYKSVVRKCVDVLVWTDPPGANGNLDPQTSLTLSPALFQRLHVDDKVCERRLSRDPCNFALAPKASIGLSIPQITPAPPVDQPPPCGMSSHSDHDPWCDQVLPIG